MSRLLSGLILGCLTAIGITTYSMLYGSETRRVDVPKGGGATAKPAPAAPAAGDPAISELSAARRSNSAEKLTAVVAELEQRTAAEPKQHSSWRLLAEALLQRVVQRGHLLGMRPGRPVYSKLPEEIVADLEAAQRAIERARQLGDDSGDLYRLEAEVMSQRIIGLASALEWNERIETAIATAAARSTDDPRLHLVLGLRKLMAPRFFGQDLEAALDHFRYADSALADDERPALFAGMVSYLTKKRLDAIAWLEKAVQRNPGNVFARVVLERLRRGEEDPFGRDVTKAEATSGK